jgi:hypothetical protein
VTHMSEYAIRKGVTAGIYPAIRVRNNPVGKILINIEEFTTTLNNIANRNITDDGFNTHTYPADAIRRIAE